MPPVVQQILRTTAESELRAQGCTPDGVCKDGHWWRGPWKGPRFILQTFGDGEMFVDEQQLRRILEDIARYRPLRDIDKTTH